MHYLLFDVSYTIFYRFYATQRWYKFANRDEEFDKDYNWFNNIQFKIMFEKKYQEMFEDIVKKYINCENYKIILAIDCPRSEIWRNAFYAEYKSTRDSSDSNNIGNYFKLVYDNIIPPILKQYNAEIMKYDNLEADDVIAITKNHIRNKNSTVPITIISSDTDLIQLIDMDTSVVSLNNKLLNNKSCGDPKIDLEIKVISGDVADNIPKCFNRCGIKTATKLANDKNLLIDRFKKEQGSFDKYSLNKFLIDFNNIPEKFVIKIKKDLNQMI